MNANGDDFLTVADIPRILKLNQQTVRNWIDQGLLPPVHVGRRVRVWRSDFEALLERGRTVPPESSGPPPAQAFWDGEYHPTPTVESGGDE
jgi:excisionase family DNA binding protein